MEIKKFMLIDLLIFTSLAILTEYIGALINRDFIYISFSQIFLLLLVIRWEGYSLIPIIITALIRPFIFNFIGVNEYLVYSLPILVLSSALLFVKLKIFDDINKNRGLAIIYFISFYLLFFLTNGLLIKLLITNDYGILNDSFKYLLTLVIGIILYYLFSGQKTMLINIKKTSVLNNESQKGNDEYDSK